MKERFSITKRDFIFLGTIVLMLLLLLKQCSTASNLENQLDIQNLNLDALNDTVRLQKNKIGEDIYVRKSLLATKQNLEKLNKDLAEELRKEKAKVLTLQKITTVIKYETKYVNNYLTRYPDGKYSLDWKYDTTYSEGNYRKIAGNSFFKIDTITGKITPGMTKIGTDESGFSFVTGIREKDGALEIFVNPKHPCMQVTNIEGAIIDPHKSDVLKKMFPVKKWSVGPYLGVGIGTGVNFAKNPINGVMVTAGFSIQRNWLKF